MAHSPQAIEELIQTLMLLPGVGRKTAERYAFFLVKQSPQTITRFQEQLHTVQKSIRLCEQCFNYTTAKRCEICTDSHRDRTTICIVAEATTLLAIEQTGQFHGLYHVLGGIINTAEGIGPKELHLHELVKRVKRDTVSEIILATNPDMSGDATALYVVDALKGLKLRITKLARGLAAGSDIEFADDLTLSSALKERKPV